MIGQSLWKNRNFRLLFAASTATNLGDGLLAVAFPWFATLLTRDPLLIGLVAAARQAPWLVLSLPAGVVTDRFNRRNILLACDLLRLGLALAAVTLALAGTGPDAIYLLIGLTFLLGSAEVLRDNTAQSILPNLVAPAQLEQANGLIWSTEHLAGQFLGPPLAGMLIAVAIALPFGAEAAMLAFAIGAISMIRLPQMARADDPTPFLPALKQGLAWLWRHPTLRRLGLVLGAYNFIGSMFYAVQVLYAQDVLHLSAVGYGWLLAVQALGGLAGSLAGPAVLRRIGASAGLISGLLAFTLCAGTMAVTDQITVIAAALFLEAFGNMLWNIASVSYRQRTIPDDLMGRVNASFRFIGTGPAAAGSATGGALLVLAAGLGAAAALHLLYALVAVGACALLAYAILHLRLR